MSTLMSVCPSFFQSVCLCVRKLQAIPAVISQNVTNKSSLVCVKSEKYAFFVNLRPLRSMRGGKAELRTTFTLFGKAKVSYVC